MTADAIATVVPNELRSRAHWLCWKPVKHPGEKKPRKLPINPRTGSSASIVDPNTWTDFDTAVAAVKRFGLEGVGYVFGANDPFAGIDLDDCRDAQTGKIEPWARGLIAQLDSYSEVSPSGTGIKIIVQAKLPPNAKHKANFASGSIEVYDQARYFTVTGLRVTGTSANIEERQAELLAMYIGVFERGYAASTPSAAKSEQLGKGRRTPMICSIIGKLNRQGVPIREIEAIALSVNRTFAEPHPEEKIRYTVSDMTSRYRAESSTPDILEIAMDSVARDCSRRERFRALCVVLQRLRGNDAVLLPVERIAEELGCHWSLVARFRREAVMEGWLKPEEKAIAHRKAASFFVLSDTAVSHENDKEDVVGWLDPQPHTLFNETDRTLVRHLSETEWISELPLDENIFRSKPGFVLG